MEYTCNLNLTQPASNAALKQLSSVGRLPKDYVDFLLQSNGAEGFVGNSYLILFPVEAIEPINQAAAVDKFAPGLIIFGSDGGGKSYAFDTRPEEVTIVEFFDMDIGDEEAVFCAKSLGGFLKYLSDQPNLTSTSDSYAGTSRKLHSLFSIGLAALVGGAFASGYLIYKNFVTVNQTAEAKRSIALFSVIGLVALFTAWNTPTDFLSFMLSVGIPQITVVSLAAWNLQAALLSMHRSVGGKLRSLWFAFFVGASVNAVIKILFYGISFVV